MTGSDARRAGIVLAILLLISGVVFSLFPQLDVWFSGLFFTEGRGFVLTGNAGFEFYRNFVWDMAIVMFVVAVAGLGLSFTGARLIGIGRGTWAFIVLHFVLGPILLSNVLLKAHWGRARPEDVSAFDGANLFTPALVPADQCLSNCSFVSGEVSAATVLGVAMLLIAPGLGRWLPGPMMVIWRGAACLLPLTIAFQRIASGRHFLSDSVFAVLFMLVIGLLLEPVFLRPSARER